MPRVVLFAVYKVTVKEEEMIRRAGLSSGHLTHWVNFTPTRKMFVAYEARGVFYCIGLFLFPFHFIFISYVRDLAGSYPRVY